MKNTTIIITICLSFLIVDAYASEPATGMFTAIRTCEAYTSFRKKRNPGKVVLTPGQSYSAIEANKADWQWLKIRIPKANPSERWVAKGCGTGRIAIAANPSTKPSQNSCSIANTYDSNVLALTWQPGFCEHANRAKTKPECKVLWSGKRSISHLTLHGLWPNKASCGIDYGQCAGPTLDLMDSTVTALAPWMPSLYYSKGFIQHEWDKHGRCQSKMDDNYFLTAKKALETVDASVIGQYLKQHIGQTIEVNQYFAHIEAKLGKAVAKRVQITCAKKRYLQEIRLSLAKNIPSTCEVKALLKNSPPFTRSSIGCNASVYIERSGVE